MLAVALFWRMARSWVSETHFENAAALIAMALVALVSLLLARELCASPSGAAKAASPVLARTGASVAAAAAATASRAPSAAAAAGQGAPRVQPAT